MRTLSVRSKQRRRTFLFHGIDQAPQNNTNSSLAVVFIFGQCIDTVFPVNVDVPAKGKDAVVSLRKVNAAIRVVVGSQKRQFTRRSKRHSDRDILVLGTVRIERSEIENGT